MDNAAISSYLFQTAAVLNAIAVPGHIVFGRMHLYPTINSLEAKSKPTVGTAAAKVGFEHMTVAIFAAAVLNWRWSTTGGPQGTDEKALFWAMLASGWVVGTRYMRVNEYGPLMICLWAPPLCALAGWALVW